MEVKNENKMYNLYKQDQASQEEHRAVDHIYREKTQKVKTQT